ncbi:general transcription factor [Lithospermum erythrorhizon]|uniref:General transcription factor n=1 Tax=Lithospermum erythrorhizon TaxID=34254 RepID=A0AAV3QSJ1_LITER
MDCDSYKVDENEPTFDVEEWMSELEAADQGHFSAANTGMDAAGVCFPSANANEHNNVKTEERLWPKTESKSDLFSGMCQISMPTASNSDNFSGLARTGVFPTTSPMVKRELFSNHFSQQTAPELKLRQKVQESVFQHSQNQPKLHYQGQQEPLAHLQSSQQYMSTTMQQTSGWQNVSNPSTLHLRPESSGVNSLIGSSTRQLDMSENRQNFVVHNNSYLLQQPGVASDSGVSIQSESMISQPNMQQDQHPMQFYHHLGTQNLRNELSHGMKQKIQVNAHFQGPIIGGQLKPNQFPLKIAHAGSSASVNNMPRDGVLFSNFAEWHDQAYNQLLTMKRLYLTEVMRIYQRYQELSSILPPNAEYAIRVEKIRIFVEKIINFLNMPRRDIVHHSKEKVFNFMNQITHFIYQNRAKLSVPSQYHHPISQPQRLAQNRNFQFNMPNGGSSSAAVGPNRSVTGTGFANARAGSSYISPRKSSMPEIPVLTNNFSQGRSTQSDLLQPCSTGLTRHSTLSAALMTSSQNKILGTCVSSTTAASSDFQVFPSQNQRNCEDRRFMQANKMQQPHQPLIHQHKHSMMGSKISENNDLKLGDTTCSSPTMFQQPKQSTSQHINHFPQSVLSSSSFQPHVAPLQSGQCSSQVDSNDFSSKVSKGALTMQSIGSPFTVPSPLMPLTPSSSLVDHVKKSSSHSPSLFSGEDSRAQNSLSQNEPPAKDSNNGAPDMIEVENSHLQPQVETEEVQEPNAENGPFKHFLEVVKSSSQKALNSALQDISAVMNLIDRRAGAALVDESRYILNHDLTDEIQSSWQDNGLLNLEYEVLPRPSRAFESFMHLSGETFDSVSNSRTKSKRIKTEANDLVMNEIKDVNKSLVETVAEIAMDRTGLSAYEAEEETIVRCSYFPVGQFATSHVGFPGLLLRLIVNRDYPHSSPSILDVNPCNTSETEEVQEITQKAASKFSRSIRKLADPMSVSVMVKAWDVSAREVYHECAKNFGGESFSSRYGRWKDKIDPIYREVPPYCCLIAYKEKGSKLSV